VLVADRPVDGHQARTGAPHGTHDGVWYTANATANYLAGILEDLLKGSSFPLYWFLVASSIGAGLLLLLITPWLKKLMHAKG
jgi:POT family proton-dependent oligopeptide transporter